MAHRVMQERSATGGGKHTACERYGLRDAQKLAAGHALQAYHASIHSHGACCWGHKLSSVSVQPGSVGPCSSTWVRQSAVRSAPCMSVGCPQRHGLKDDTSGGAGSCPWAQAPQSSMHHPPAAYEPIRQHG
jgi:hypothetical protein